MKTIKVSIDAGALINNKYKQYGNYVFTRNLLLAIGRIDRKNSYTLYLQNKINNFDNFKLKLFKPNFGWLKTWVTVEEITNPKDIFLAINQALPLYTKGKKIVFCHGIAPLLYARLYPDSHKQMKQQIKDMILRADNIIVGSIKLKRELTRIGKEKNINLSISVLNYGIPSHFIEASKRFKKKNLLLYVGSSHPIKNLSFILESFSYFVKLPKYQNYKLVLAGVSNNLTIAKNIKDKIIIFNHVDHDQLLKLYNESRCLLTASLYESFNLPVLEALSQNTNVIGTKSAIVPELLPYVRISANSPIKFAQNIKCEIENPKKINLGKLKEQFDWNNFVKKLIALYK